MQTTTLGRTGLTVSVIGVGCGGPSRVGQRTGRTAAESVAVIQEALDAGVNFIDTAEAYGTEAIAGQAIKGRDRGSLVLSTKKSVRRLMTGQDVRESLEASLKNLGTDYVDVYHLHGVLLKDYEHLLAEIVPTLHDLRHEGKLRHIGVTEMFGRDPQHAMLQRALQDEVWEVIMVGFNLLNQSARKRVFARTIAQEVGVLIMFAVRRALSRPERLAEIIKELVENGQLDPDDIDRQAPLDFVVHELGAVSIPDAAYRFCRDEPGTDVILSGTGNVEHLRANLASFERPPLPAADVAKLVRIFRLVDSVSGG